MNILDYLTRFVQQKFWVKIRVTGRETLWKHPSKVGKLPTHFEKEPKFLMRIMISKVVMDCIQRGLSPNNSSEYAINLLEKKLNGKGGIVCLDKNGMTGYAFNTERMAVTYINGNGQMKVSV